MGVPSNIDCDFILKEYMWLVQQNAEDEAWDQKGCTNSEIRNYALYVGELLQQLTVQWFSRPWWGAVVWLLLYAQCKAV